MRRLSALTAGGGETPSSSPVTSSVGQRMLSRSALVAAASASQVRA